MITITNELKYHKEKFQSLYEIFNKRLNTLMIVNYDSETQDAYHKYRNMYRDKKVEKNISYWKELFESFSQFIYCFQMDTNNLSDPNILFDFERKILDFDFDFDSDSDSDSEWELKDACTECGVWHSINNYSPDKLDYGCKFAIIEVIDGIEFNHIAIWKEDNTFEVLHNLKDNGDQVWINGGWMNRSELGSHVRLWNKLPEPPVIELENIDIDEESGSYWEARCKLAEKYIENSNDATTESWDAYSKWVEICDIDIDIDEDEYNHNMKFLVTIFNECEFDELVIEDYKKILDCEFVPVTDSVRNWRLKNRYYEKLIEFNNLRELTDFLYQFNGTLEYSSEIPEIRI